MWEPVKQGGIIKNKMFNIYQTKGTQLSNEKSIYVLSENKGYYHHNQDF